MHKARSRSAATHPSLPPPILLPTNRSSRATHIGRGAQRPFNHGWMLADWQRRAFPAYNAEGMAHQTADPDFVRRTLWLYAVTDPDLNQKHGRCVEWSWMLTLFAECCGCMQSRTWI
eukprot:1157218-Pelagomonas_calceolata.AAC.19